MPLDAAEPPAMPGIELASLAAGALAKISNDSKQDQVDAGPTPPVTEHDVVPPILLGTGRLPSRRDGKIFPTKRGPPSPLFRPHTATRAYTPHSPRDRTVIPRMELQSPTRLPSTAHAEGLPPIHSTSPRSESNGNAQLPSIRMQLGDINQLSLSHGACRERQGSAADCIRAFPARCSPAATEYA